MVLHFSSGHCSGCVRFATRQLQGLVYAAECRIRRVPSHTFLFCLLCTIVMLAVAVAVILCFGDADNATIGLMVMCGFVCAAGAAASMGGRAYVSLLRMFASLQFATQLTVEQGGQRVCCARRHLVDHRCVHLLPPPVRRSSAICMTIILTACRCCRRHCMFHMRASQRIKCAQWHCRLERSSGLLGCWFASQMS